MGATQAPFLQRQHRHKQGCLKPQDSRVLLVAPLYSRGGKQANAGFYKEDIAGGLPPPSGCLLRSLRTGQEWPGFPLPFQCGLQLAVTFRANSETASDLGRNVGNVCSQERPPPTCGPGMWALSHLWPPREVHMHMSWTRTGSARTRNGTVSWKTVWQNYLTQRAKSDCQCHLLAVPVLCPLQALDPQTLLQFWLVELRTTECQGSSTTWRVATSILLY